MLHVYTDSNTGKHAYTTQKASLISCQEKMNIESKILVLIYNCQ
jgi:hypothetical protein